LIQGDNALSHPRIFRPKGQNPSEIHGISIIFRKQTEIKLRQAGKIILPKVDLGCANKAAVNRRTQGASRRNEKLQTNPSCSKLLQPAKAFCPSPRGRGGSYPIRSPSLVKIRVIRVSKPFFTKRTQFCSILKSLDLHCLRIS
jgi:hypothetical protein